MAVGLKLENNNRCFVCGKENPHGLQMDFEMDADGVMRSQVQFAERFQGFAGIVHGGIVATILDEIMVNVALWLGENAVTAGMTVKLRKPVYVGDRILFEGRIDKSSGRRLLASARAFHEDGTLVAEAEGILFRVKDLRSFLSQPV